jgi:hypothetical protein
VPDKALDVYLNDHLAGATLGSELAEQIRSQTEGSPLGEVMRSIAVEIDEDRETLSDLMDRMGLLAIPHHIVLALGHRHVHMQRDR